MTLERMHMTSQAALVNTDRRLALTSKEADRPPGAAWAAVAQAAARSWAAALSAWMQIVAAASASRDLCPSSTCQQRSPHVAHSLWRHPCPSLRLGQLQSAAGWASRQPCSLAASPARRHRQPRLAPAPMPASVVPAALLHLPQLGSALCPPQVPPPWLAAGAARRRST